MGRRFVSSIVGLAVSTSAFAGEWSYKAVPDPFVDGSDRHIATLVSRDNEGSLGLPTISVRCSPKKDLEIIITVGELVHVNPNKTVNFVYRFDSHPPLHSRGHIASERQYFFVTEERAPQFSAALALSQELALRVTGHEGNKHTVVYNLSGQDRELLRVRKACNLGNELDQEGLALDLKKRQPGYPGNDQQAIRLCLEKVVAQGSVPFTEGELAPTAAPGEEHIFVVGIAKSTRAEAGVHLYTCIWEDGMLRSFSGLD